MKKTLSMLLALILCVLTLCGCARTPASAAGSTAAGTEPAVDAGVPDAPDGSSATLVEMPLFDEIDYFRPEQQIKDLRAGVDELAAALEGGAQIDRIEEILDRCFDSYDSFDTMYAVAEIRACLDMTNEYYNNEYDWCLDSCYELDAMMDELYYLCGESPLAKQLEEEYFWPGFAEKYADSSQSSFSDELKELTHRESELLSEYRSLIASPTIPVDGQETDLYEYLDRVAGDEYFETWMRYYRIYSEKLGKIYIELVRVRGEMARVMGYDSYQEMAYKLSYDRDYTPEQARAYLDDIRRWMVPLYTGLAEAGELDRETLRDLDEPELEQILRSAAAEMGGEVRDTFEHLREFRLYDISYSGLKMSKSFQTYLKDYEEPFVFLDPDGDLSDVTSFAHEFGHALDAYHNKDAYESLDLAECFSQAMELLALDYSDTALSEREREQLIRFKALDNLSMYVQQGSFAEFEELVYSTDPDKLTVEMLNDFSLRTAVDYGYCEAGYEEYYALSWIDITHFFETPFYVISYPVSNDVAMQIGELEQQMPGAGLGKYLEMLPRESEGLIETVEAAGLQSPFAPGRIEKAAADLRAQIGGESLAAAA